MDPGRRIIADGALLVRGDRIVEVGKAHALPARFPHEVVHRFPDHLIIPGLVDTHVHLAQALIRGCADGRIRVWFGPRTPGAVTPDLYREIARLAAKHGLGITMHLAEVREDREFLRRAYGRLPVEFAEDVGLLGPHVVLVHMIWIGEGEMRTLARTGTHVSHNPSSNSKLGSGVCPVPALLGAGVNVALGCDGGPSNNT